MLGALQNCFASGRHCCSNLGRTSIAARRPMYQVAKWPLNEMGRSDLIEFPFRRQRPRPQFIATSAGILTAAKSEEQGVFEEKKADEMLDLGKVYVNKAFVNWTSAQVASWLRELSVPEDQSAKWSLEGRQLADRWTQKCIMTTDDDTIVYRAIREKTCCNEANLKSIVYDVIETLSFKKIGDLPHFNHAKVLKTFYKQDLDFNPYNPLNFDIRFMRKTGLDTVYQMFESFAKYGTDRCLFPLQGLSGGGKTGTILNAVGRNRYLIFIECTDEEIVDTCDYVDKPFKNFTNILSSHMVLSLGDPTGEKKTQYTIIYCQVFWLCRLMMLQAMKEKYDISPEEWILWTNDEKGQRAINSIQNLFFSALLDELHQSTDSYNAQFSQKLHLLIEKYIKETGAWFAIDEAQIAHKKIFTKTRDDEVDSTEYNDLRRSLLHLLSIYALPSDSKRIIAGTSITDFVCLLKSGAAKKSKIFDFVEEGLSFPYVEPDDAWKRLTELVNLSQIKSKHKAAAKEVLQGRLRYVFGFINQLATRIAQCPNNELLEGFTKDQANSIFMDALKAHKKSMTTYFTDRWNKLVDNGVCMYYCYIIMSNMLTALDHLHHVVLSQTYSPLMRWDTSFINERYSGVSVEDTGFLFVETLEKEKKSVYAIREPFVVKALLSNPNIANKTVSLTNLLKVDSKKPTKRAKRTKKTK